MECKKSRASQWATRATLELKSHPDFSSCFLTLTYSDEGLPGPSLVPEHLTLFWKRLRRNVGKFRYLACGEYGEASSRPHYHALVFGWRPADLVSYSSTLFQSPQLNVIWSFGRVLVGDVTPASAAYVAGYVSKKLSQDSYPPFIVPPFLRVSAKPALGSVWIRANYNDLADDRIYLSPGRLAPVPKHVLSLLEVDAPHLFAKIKRKRRSAAARADFNFDGPSRAEIETNSLARLKPRDFSEF
nr:MAG: replication initiator protein [Microviridae sp.]